ncbi:YolD-like family protein [Brevibacillus panacihumi]|uniref:YolD-like family protein n=1 Tax=Brevibacillus panacihumi TaxID=497735 RepID=A0A3M8CQX4_9BACL|nr:YolD-like family protein [Brevibacillus panacihumi]RNB78018.1 hypothetical protein EDM58_13515 [Brevibacillus panacihumi]
MAKKMDDLFDSMRVALPEQRATNLENNEILGFEPRPEIDEEDFGEMCFRIYDSTQYNYPINVKWFIPQKGDFGTFESAWGVVREIDKKYEQFKLVSDWESHWINVRDLVSVKK